MKAIIVYYSLSGITHRFAQALAARLEEVGHETTLARLSPVNEYRTYFSMCKDALLGRRPELFKTVLDLSPYDAAVFASPVWCFRPAPPVNAYIDRCLSLEGKNVICAVTSSPGGAGRAVDGMARMVLARRGNVVGKFGFSGSDNPHGAAGKMARAL